MQKIFIKEIKRAFLGNPRSYLAFSIKIFLRFPLLFFSMPKKYFTTAVFCGIINRVKLSHYALCKAENVAKTLLEKATKL